MGLFTKRGKGSEIVLSKCKLFAFMCALRAVRHVWNDKNMMPIHLVIRNGIPDERTASNPANRDHYFVSMAVASDKTPEGLWEIKMEFVLQKEATGDWSLSSNSIEMRFPGVKKYSDVLLAVGLYDHCDGAHYIHESGNHPDETQETMLQGIRQELGIKA